MQTWDAELVPVAIASMIIAIAYNPNFALMVTFALSVLTCIALGTGIPHFLVVMGGTAAGVLTLTEVRTRTKLIKVGATASLTYFLLTWATGFWQDQPIDLVRSDSFWRAGWGLMAGFFLGGSLPFLEGALGIVTGISLLELGDNTHPLLQELVRRAPGTHNHSITVGRDRRGGGRAHRRRCLARPHRRLLPRHRQDAQAPLFRREPGRLASTGTPSSPRR